MLDLSLGISVPGTINGARPPEDLVTLCDWTSDVSIQESFQTLTAAIVQAVETRASRMKKIHPLVLPDLQPF
ncbi:hypothetical protein E2C01_092973 [Portunus trituberculatus]|uniref:Uncharacterized protein n=1 Tax=Portunus trituberculatus TaxID=210409 RepID=A0A5B7JS46_PORTR|nr:hypothetical protein [Portunus trituberculatus]